MLANTEKKKETFDIFNSMRLILKNKFGIKIKDANDSNKIYGEQMCRIETFEKTQEIAFPLFLLLDAQKKLNKRFGLYKVEIKTGNEAKINLRLKNQTIN